MTTTVESALADMLEGLSVSDGYYTLTIGRVGAVKLAERIVKNEPDLLAALDATANEDGADIEHIHHVIDTIKRTGGSVEIRGVRIEPCDTYGATDTTRARDALRAELEKVTGSADAWWGEYDAELKAHAETKARAERAEAALAACTERCNEHVQAAIKRAEDAEAFGAAAVARAEEAEATVAAVREHVEDDHIWWPNSAQREGLRKILDPKPAFTLPTEAGARFEATHKGTGTRNEFVTFTDGSNAVYVLHEGTYWVAEDVMNGFEGFRLLGADQ